MRKIVFLILVLLLVVPSLGLEAQTVDLLWQGDTYTPPFYRGKALWSNQSRINFVAIPQGLGDSTKLNYKWTKSGTVLGNINGIGKNTLTFVDSVLARPQTIKVEIVSSDKKTVLASRSVYVTPITPLLTVYENNPLYGFMFHKETDGTFALVDKEVTFTAFPLFFSVSNRQDSFIGYEWLTNVGGEAETKNSVTYRSPDDTSGKSEVRVQASNIDKIMQSADKSFLIQFGK